MSDVPPALTDVLPEAQVLMTACEGAMTMLGYTGTTPPIAPTSAPHAGYAWIGHKPGSGFSDLAPSILHYKWF
jgi:hypothetical protein